MDKALIKFLENSINKLSEAKVNQSLDESLRHSYDYTEQAYRNILQKINWLNKTPELKQCQRILQLAKSREQDWDVTNQLKEISLYSKIREAIPYIQAVSYKINNEEKHLTEDLLTFCQEWLDYIDSSDHKSEIKFPSKEAIVKAFKSYLEFIGPDKIPSLKVYKQPEVKKKIEELYREFVNLHEAT